MYSEAPTPVSYCTLHRDGAFGAIDFKLKLNTLLNFKITFIIREWKTHYQFSFRFFRASFLSLGKFLQYSAFVVYLVVDRCFMLDVNKQLHSRFLQFLYLYGLQEGEL